MSVGALMILGVPALTVARHIQLHKAGASGMALLEGGVTALGIASMFAVPFGFMLIIAGYLRRRSGMIDEQDTPAARKARREAARNARPTHSD
jgi:hypothetical protein